MGRNYMRRVTGAVFATFEKPVRMHRGETMAGIVAEESRNDPERGFVSGYYIQLHSLGPAFLANFLSLFVSDGSVMTTGAAANPTLTIVALALRQADHIEGQLKAGAL